MAPVSNRAPIDAFDVRCLQDELQGKVATFAGDRKRLEDIDVDVLFERASPKHRQSVTAAAEAYATLNQRYCETLRQATEEGEAAGKKLERTILWSGLGTGAAAGVACALTFGTPFGWAMCGVAVAAFFVMCCAYLFREHETKTATAKALERFDLPAIAAATGRARAALDLAIKQIVLDTPAPPAPAPTKPRSFWGKLFGG